MEKFTSENRYMVLTEEEAQNLAIESIRESLWAFNPNFIIKHSKIKISPSVLFKIQEETCEGCNEIVYAMLDDFNKFCEDAICSDGRGHFLNTYDGKETEIKIGTKTLFMYRME